MKNTAHNIKLRVAVFAMAILLTALALPAFADYPKPDKFVADSAAVLAESTVLSIQKSNENLREDYGAVVAVCTVKNTGDESLAEYARAVFTDWKMGDGVLLLIVTDEPTYYFVQSKGIEDVITNEQLKTVRSDYLEPDFATGNIDRGVNKTVTKLTSLIQSGLAKKAAEEKEMENADGNNGTLAGRIIVTVLKIILWTAIAAVALFAVMFVLALFNDDVAEIMRKYIFARGKKKTDSRIPSNYYDERLYGRSLPERTRNGSAPRPKRQPEPYPAEQRRPRQRVNHADAQQRMYSEYSNQRQNRADVYYNADGTVRRGSRQDGASRNGQQPADDSTRMFSVPNQRR